MLLPGLCAAIDMYDVTKQICKLSLNLAQLKCVASQVTIPIKCVESTYLP